MAGIGRTLTGSVVGVIGFIVLAFAIFASAEHIADRGASDDFESGSFFKISNLLLHKAKMYYQHFWPDLEFRWRVIVASVIGFLAVVFGSVGDVGGDAIFVPMLTLIIGFDPKTSIAISICMITGAAGATVLRSHLLLDHPIFDSDLALLLQPMLLLGISIGVVLNIIFAEWMVTALLIILIIVTSTRSFFKGVEAWKEETRLKKMFSRDLASTSEDEEEHKNEDAGAEDILYKLLPRGPRVRNEEVVYWKDFNILIVVWVILVFLNIFKTYTSTCSTTYWIVYLLQIPVAVGASAYEAVRLYKGTRVVMLSGKEVITRHMGMMVVMSGGETATWKVHQLILYCCCGILAGTVGGLLGLDGGFILGPLFLQLGISPQVSRITAAFVMIFSSSMSIVQYYLLGHFPVPYALYFVAVVTVAALVEQLVIRKIISILDRFSVVILILAFTVFVSALSLGGVGIADAIKRIKDSIWGLITCVLISLEFCIASVFWTCNRF